MLKAGVIRDLELQPKFDLQMNGKHVAFYYADFRYWDIEKNREVVEDAKGIKTKVYQLKKKLVLACCGIKIEEV